MTAQDIALNHSQLFLTRALEGCERVLEVGCGGGQLAWRLAHLGHEVVALDIALAAHRPTHPRLKFVKSDFYVYRADPFDAVVFTSSLHHLAPLPGALKRARALLRPGGLLVVDELDIQAPDEQTARWYYEAQGLLATAGLAAAHHGHHGSHGAHSTGKEHQAPLLRWREEHRHAPALHTGAAMLKALRASSEILEESRCAYLFRALSATVTDSARGLKLAQWLLATEERRIADRCLEPVGLRVVGRV